LQLSNVTSENMVPITGASDPYRNASTLEGEIIYAGVGSNQGYDAILNGLSTTNPSNVTQCLWDIANGGYPIGMAWFSVNCGGSSVAIPEQSLDIQNPIINDKGELFSYDPDTDNSTGVTFGNGGSSTIGWQAPIIAGQIAGDGWNAHTYSAWDYNNTNRIWTVAAGGFYIQSAAAFYLFGQAATSGHYCLQIDSIGLVTNTGSACGSGGGTTTNALTANTSGGAAPGSTFNGGAAVTFDYHSFGAAPLASPTFTGKVTTAAASTGSSGFNIPQGTAPTAPGNGDIWTTSGGLYAQIAGSTIGPFGTTGSGTVSSGSEGQFCYYAANGTTCSGHTIVGADLPGTVVESNTATSYTAGAKQTFQASSTTAGFSWGGVTADPSSPSNGDEDYRTDLTRAGIYTGSAWHRFAFTDDTYSGGISSSQVTTGLGYTPANCTAGTSGSDCLTLSSGLVPTANMQTSQVTRTATISDIYPSTNDDLLITVLDPATAVQLTRFSCGVTGLTNVVVNLISGGNSLISNLTATVASPSGDPNTVVTTTWANGSSQCGSTSYCAVAAHTSVVLHIASISGTPSATTSLNCALDYTVN
jgi:hypothetical protein